MVIDMGACHILFFWTLWVHDADIPDVEALFRQRTDVNDLVFVSSSGLKLFWFPNESDQYQQTVISNSLINKH